MAVVGVGVHDAVRDEVDPHAERRIALPGPAVLAGRQVQSSHRAIDGADVHDPVRDLHAGCVGHDVPRSALGAAGGVEGPDG
jgi:hypothetical protein